MQQARLARGDLSVCCRGPHDLEASRPFVIPAVLSAANTSMSLSPWYIHHLSLSSLPSPDPNAVPPCSRQKEINTHSVFLPERLGEGRAHDLPPQVGGSREVNLSLGASRRGDHLEVFVEGERRCWVRGGEKGRVGSLYARVSGPRRGAIPRREGPLNSSAACLPACTRPHAWAARDAPARSGDTSARGLRISHVFPTPLTSYNAHIDTRTGLASSKEHNDAAYWLQR